MLNRYLGNKKAIIQPIMNEIRSRVPAEGLVCDAFSGSLAVAFELKKAGYVVACNDINLFSHFYGKHLIEQCELPDLDLTRFFDTNELKTLTKESLIIMSSLIGGEGYDFLKKEDNQEKYLKIIVIYVYLNKLISTEGIKPEHRYFYNTYTEEGNASYFESSRGSKGHRRFFKPSNGLKLDLLMEQLRGWFKNGKFKDSYLYYTLICSVIDAVEKVSNTQGTYHDFPRKKYDSRSLNDLVLTYPTFDGVIAPFKKHIVGKSEDSIDFVKKLPMQDLLYLDPPYNFRQYTSYYFLPNVICEYAEIEDLDGYFSEVKHVRGQNMSNDYKSSFSKKREFISSLEKLVSNCECKNVVMSYFDGRNHWNNTSFNNDHKGIEILSDFFRSKLFLDGSLQVLPFERLNYQSYGGHKARYINELLFMGVKK